MPANCEGDGGFVRNAFFGEGTGPFLATVNGDNVPSMIGSFATVLIPKLVLAIARLMLSKTARGKAMPMMSFEPADAIDWMKNRTWQNCSLKCAVLPPEAHSQRIR